MGEVVVSSGAGMELEVEARKAEKQSETGNTTADGAAAASAAESGVRWERFLPKMAVRVLLVEADDSTRQIIAALLRKCSYRVAAVSDGLKAWEVLKGSPCNIDLILTEVELPSISGYALLTLIMEHEVCKNIPVIMMSSQDSVSTVYKCMLRGATDFLVKPVRKNELRNLWQHVWRKQASNTAAGLGPPDESVEQKDETSGENNAVSNHSSGGYMSCVPRNGECAEKRSDAQSSCTKPESETEGVDAEHGYCLPQPKSNICLSDDANIPIHEERVHGYASGEPRNVVDMDAENTRVLENSAREAIDLIGTFDNHHLSGNFGGSVSNVNVDKFDVSPHLDLSLRRPHPSGSVNEVNDERPRLNHSDASAFSRYINKPAALRTPTSPITCNQHIKDQETNSENQSSDYTLDNRASMTTVQNRQPEITFSYSQNREISHPIPVRGVRFENKVNTYNPVMPSLCRAQSGSSSLSSPQTARPADSFPQLSPFCPSDNQPSSPQQFHNLNDLKIGDSIGQAENKSENLEDQGPGNNDQSGNSNFCNDNKSNDKVYAVSVIKAPLECGNNKESLHVHELASQRSMQREAALNKFRMKRKERCFEKKVRYESRKKLAEQRPRVKGQFVRQLPNESQTGNSSAC